MRELAKGVFVETAYWGCNHSFILTGEGIVMVDSPQKPTEALQWRAIIEKKGEIRYLINTEFHPDHVLGNFFFPATVIAHQGAKELFLSSLGGVERVRETVAAIDPKGVAHLKDYKPREPSITFSERLSLYLGDKTLNLINLAGHSPYQAAVYLPEEKVVFTGDNVVNKTPPLFHSAVHPDTWLKTLDAIGCMDVDFIVPGHGEVCDKGVLPGLKESIREIVREVQSCIDKGLSKEETTKKVAYIRRFLTPPGLEARYQLLQSLGIGNIYEKLTGMEG